MCSRHPPPPLRSVSANHQRRDLVRPPSCPRFVQYTIFFYFRGGTLVRRR
ncbi:hypothetical protein LINPERHAP1_LOCUS30160 [Linum perenne]